MLKNHNSIQRLFSGIVIFTLTISGFSPPTAQAGDGLKRQVK